MTTPSPRSIDNPPARPLLIWDGDCSFCRRWITRWQHLTGSVIDYEPYQTAAEKFPGIPRENFGKGVHLIETDGAVKHSATAVFRSLALGGHYRWLAWLYRRIPPFAWVCELIYRLIARNRSIVDKVDKIIVGRQTRPATYALTRAVFLRLLGVVYLIAFISLFVQIDGLIGSNGILPVSNFVEAATRAGSGERFWRWPTLVYFNSSDAFLHTLCIGGIICSCLLIVGVAPLLMTIALWASYLSLVVAGQYFLSFQWDALLLETGFLAILWSPPLWAGMRKPPSRIVLFLFRWLLFRLMLLSALVKWFSGDEGWRNMTALRFHFETQPLPTWTSWYTHHNPHWLLAASCFLMFVVEAIVPFLYFAPRRTRMLAFWLTVLFQLSIMATGNYGFFNILTIALAVTLLDDAALAKVAAREPPRLTFSRPRLRPFLLAPIVLVLLVVTSMQGIRRCAYPERIDWPKPLAWLQDHIGPFHIANSYGLFADMTEQRPEIIIEGSDDGQTWLPYVFKYKPGDVTRRPGFCGPHMPRLDWQMWFAALGSYEWTPWFDPFLVALLEGKPQVLDLLEPNPFPNRPPRLIRAVLYNYRFSDGATRQSSSAWWVRTPLRLYAPVRMLERRRQVEDAFRL